jgi:hypothetical protein
MLLQVPPHFEHLQACAEPLDNDGALGPKSSLTMSATFAPSLTAVEEREMLARTRTYRDAVENGACTPLAPFPTRAP